MRVEVAGYDGIIEFPDDMPQDEVASVLQRQFPPINSIANTDGSWKVDTGSLPLQPIHPSPIRQTVIKQAPEPSLTEKFTGGIRDLFGRKEQKDSMDSAAAAVELVNREAGLPFKKDISDKLKDIKERPSQLVPFLSGAVELADIVKVAESAHRLENNTATEDDLKMLKAFRDKNSEDATFGYKVLDVISNLPAFAGELLATSGIYTAGKKATLKGTERVIKSLLSESGEELLKKRAMQIAVKSAGGIVGGTLQTPVSGGFRIATKAVEKEMPTFADSGGLEKGDDVLTAVAKAFGDQWVETVSEHSGGLFTELGRAAKSELVKKGILKSFLGANPSATAKDFHNILRKAGWNGVINEMLEERVGEAGRAALGLSKYKLPTPEQLAVELMAFSIPGSTIKLADRVLKTQSPLEDKKVLKDVAPVIKDSTKDIVGILTEGEANKKEYQAKKKAEVARDIIAENIEDAGVITESDEHRGSPERPRGGVISTAAIWDKTPMDIQQVWSEAMDYTESKKNEIMPKVTALKNELKSLKGKLHTDRRNLIKEQIADLEADYKGLFGEYEQAAMDESLTLRDDAIRRAKERGLTDEDALERFAEDFLMESSAERPYIEYNHDKPVKQIFDEVIKDYLPESVDAKAHEAAASPLNSLAEPTDAQKEAGNYKKGHINIQDLDISIENPKGSLRSGTDKSGKQWSVEIKSHYGYIKGTKGKDKDHIDTFIGAKPENDRVYVVNQVDPSTGKFDEHKVMLGFDSLGKARRGYLENYEEGWKGIGSIAPMSMDEFKTWIKEGDTTRPIEGKASAEKTETAGGDVNISGEQPIHKMTSPHSHVASFVKDRLSSGQALTKKELWDISDEAFGGKKSEGKYTPKDAYDAMEMGINQHLQDMMRANRHITSIEAAQTVIDRIRGDILNKIPSQQGNRTEEQDEFQQFSTPPDLAYVMSWAANIKAGDTVLEPSAGIGGLASFAKAAGAKTVVNELSPRRAEILKGMGFDEVYTENAEQIHNILPESVKPTVVIMNPPFSSTAGRIKGERSAKNGIAHMDQALARLERGGRAVILMGVNKFGDSKLMQDWFKSVADKYSLRAIIEISGKGYAKYGTDYDNRIIVIDKTPKISDNVIKARVEDVKDAIPLLKEVRDARIEAQADRKAESIAGEQVGKKEAGRGRREAGSEPTERVSTDDVVSGESGVSAGERDIQPKSGKDINERSAGEPDVSARESGRGSELPVTGADRGKSRGRRSADNSRGHKEEEAGRSGVDADRLAGQRDEVGQQAELPAGESIGVEASEKSPERKDLTDSVFEEYRPSVKIQNTKKHPGRLVQSAAMASVEQPKPAYKPKLDTHIIETGKLSDAQIESIVYAGQSHQQVLPSGERKGYFIGDGTGVGKGREIAGIIMDNMNQGRKKAVWISERQALINDAVRDWKGIGGNGDRIISLGKVKAGAEVTSKDGIVFTTYKLLSTGAEASNTGELKSKAGKASRFDQIVQWLGKDFDGVIVFDESHNMQNAVTTEGTRGKKKPSLQALAGIALQKAFPNARVVYVSATGATEVSNLAYAERLGLWGEGTPFPNKHTFIADIEKGGIAAMEVVARDMKAMGVYNARSLSFDDVTYGRLEHKLTTEQRKVYDELAKAWQIVLNNVDKALDVTQQKGNGNAKGAALSTFWGSHQRFFNQVITSMQMPSALNDIQKQIAAGNAVVLQLVNTNEAIQNRQIAKQAASDEDIEDLDLTPRESLMQYIENAFPTQQYQEVQDEDGNKRYEPVVDSNGNPVQNRIAIEMREKLLDKLGSIKVPDGPLELIINTFGHDRVAEVTGRTKRIVRVRDVNDRIQTEVQKRSAKLAIAEAEEFQADKRQILVFSDAGSTGRSFHSDLNAKNKRKRIHYLIQPGWRADKAVQGFGRTHRTNQAQAPHYVLVTTDLNGQKRFLSSIARRLDQLGAMTKGQRQAGSQGLFSAKDNLESQYANAALEQFIRELHRDEIHGLDFATVTDAMGLNGMVDKTGNLNDTKMPDIPKFLNRILSLDIELQNKVFGTFYERLEKNVDKAIADGTLDFGLENYKADGVILKGEQVVYTHPQAGAETNHITLEAKHKVSFVPFDDAAGINRFKGFYKSSRTGNVWAVRDYGSRTDMRGNIVSEVKLVGPEQHHARVMELDRLENEDNWKKVAEAEAREWWEKKIKESPKYRTEDLHLISGALLPIWDRLPQKKTRVIRIQTDDGKRFVGRIIHENDLQSTLKKLGASTEAKEYSPEDIQSRIVEDNAAVTLVNGWVIKRRLVQGEPRIEITAKDNSLWASEGELQKHGVFKERIQYETRFFIPSGEEGIKTIEAITANRPVVDVLMPQGGKDVTLDMMGMQNIYEHTVDFLKKMNPKAAGNIEVVGRKKDLGAVKGLIGSPGSIEGKARYYVVHAKNAVHKQDRLRGMADDKMQDIFKPLKSKDLRSEFEALEWMGDVEGKTYTADELDELGVNPKVKGAYLHHRKFHEQVWRLLSSHRKSYGGETGHIEGHVPHLFENWNVYELNEEIGIGEDGETRDVPGSIMGTFRSLKEATAFANGLDSNQRYIIKPKTFRMPDELIQKTVMKDASYFKMVERMEDAFSLSRDEAFEMVNDIARRKNRRRMLGSLMKRKGQSGFRQDDLHQILKEYYYSVARYVALDDFKARVVPKFERDFGVELGRGSEAVRDKNVARYVEEYINDMNGVPGMVEDLIDASVKRYLGSFVRSERPTIWAVNKALHFTGVMKLGLFNLSAGVVNLTQLVNTFSKVPLKHFAWGFVHGLKPSGKYEAILRRIGVEFDLGLANTGGYSMSHKGGRLVKASMIFFSGAEHINRRVTALAAYRQARKDLGMSEREARLYARQTVDKTQFDYSVADTARIFRNPTGRLLGQFKPYAIKQIEFIVGLKGAENIKFWIPMLLMAGTMGIPLIEGLSELIEWLTGKDPILETKKFLMHWAGGDKDKKKVAEIVIYGVGSQLGVDVSRRVGIGDIIPRRASDLLGPTINTLRQAKDILERGDKTEFVRSLAPSVGNVITAVETVRNGMEVRDPYHRDRLKYTAKPSEVAIKALGLRPVRESEMADIEQIRQYEDKKYNRVLQKYTDKAVNALMDGNAEGFADAIVKAADEGVIIDDRVIQNEILLKVLPQDVRMLLKTRMMQRPDYMETLDFLRED